MRHRLTGNLVTGLGNPESIQLDNTGKINRKYTKAVMKEYFEHWGWFDFQVTKDHVAVGIEPAYQYDPLRIVCIAKDIGESYVQYGKAFGYYGSNVLGNKRYFKDYKTKCKFVNFVTQWHKELFG